MRSSEGASGEGFGGSGLHCEERLALGTIFVDPLGGATHSLNAHHFCGLPPSI